MKTPRRQVLTGLAGGLVLATAPVPMGGTALADEPADSGKISRVKGDASAQRGTTKIAFAEGTGIKVGDIISTGNDARLEITFADDTKMVLGANAKLTIDTYLYDPAKSKGSTLLDLAKGAFRFTTGKLASLTDKDVAIKTSFASLSVRGTDLWGGPIDKQNGVIAFDGTVEVKTPKGSVLLQGGKLGTMIASSDVAPTVPKQWAAAKIAKAAATVAF
jgi:hypothetical protein